MGFYKLLYIKLYLFTLKTPSAEENPEHIASIVLSVVMVFSAFIIVLSAERLGFPTASIFFESYIPATAIFVLTGVVNYFIFIRGKSYIGFIEKYQKLSKKKRKSDTIICLIYFLLTAVFFMMLA